MARRWLVSFIACAVSLAVVASPTTAATQGINGTPVMVHYQTPEKPFDVDVSPDGEWAAVRTGSVLPGAQGYAGHLHLIHLAPPFPVTSYFQEMDVSFWGSEALRIFDDRLVSLAGAQGQSDAYVQLQDGLPLSLSPAMSAIGIDVDAAIQAATGHLVAVSRGWTGLSATDLETSQPIPTYPVPVHSTNGTGLYSSGISNAVRTTPARFIAIANSYLPDAPNQYPGWVGIGALGQMVGVTFGLGGCIPNQSACNSTTQGLSVHDVTLTPNQKYAIVSGNRSYGVYDMAGASELSNHWITGANPAAQPLPWVSFRTAAGIAAGMTTDSVESSNSRAVIVGHNNAPHNTACPSGTDQARWRVAIINLRTLDDVVYEDAPVGCASSRAHDVAITPNGAYAFMTTRGGTYRIDLNSAWPTRPPDPYWDGTDPLDTSFGSAFVADSIVCTNTRAVAIGRNISTFTPQAIVINVNLSPDLSGAYTFVELGQSNSSKIVPTDVVIDPSEQFAVVRSTDVAGPPSINKYGRISVINLSTGTLVGEWDHTSFSTPPFTIDFGAAWGVDHVEATAEYAITAGEDVSGNVGGWFQVLKLP